MMMRMGKTKAWAFIAVAMTIAAQPAFASNKDRNKRGDTATDAS